jgi:AAA domain/DnaB-like helicase N terminal domain
MRDNSKSQRETLYEAATNLPPPHSLHAELALLGTLLYNNGAYDKVANFLQPHHFYDRRNGQTFGIFARLITDGKVADHVTIREHLTGIDDVDSYLKSLVREASTSLCVADYGEMIFDLALRRNLLTLSEEMRHSALLADLDVTPLQQIEEIERKLSEIKLRDSFDADFDFRKMLRKKFTLVDDIEANIVKEEIVEGVLGVGESSCWYGPPGVAKSVLVEDLALHVACGLPWHGRNVRQGAVVYVALERESLVKRRAVAFRLSKAVQGAPFAIVGGVYDLRDPGAAAQLVGVIRDIERETEQKAALIVIDTVSRALSGGNENSPEDMGAVVASDSILKAKTGAHIAWIHHSPIGAERLRGHSSLLGAMDVTVSVTKNGNIRTATIDKINDGMDGVVTTFTLESVVVGKDKDGKITTAPIVVPLDTDAAIARPSPSRLPKAAEIALRALAEVVLDHGAVPAASPYIPAGVKVVEMDAWRQQAYLRGISASDQPRAKQVAFARAVQQLLTAGRVATYDDKVWIIS